MTTRTSPTKQLAVHSGLCSYKVVDGQTGPFSCTLGCSNVLYPKDNGGGSSTKSFNPGQFSVPPPNFTPVRQGEGERDDRSDGGKKTRKLIISEFSFSNIGYANC